MAKILIAEDERAINDLIKLNLTLVGHKCEQVFDGASALEYALSGQYDLLILDVMLPELSGFEIIGQIKTPVIFVTARVSAEDRIRGLKLGADDYIVKPFEMQELLARVAVVLRRVHKNSTSISFDNIIVEFDSRKVFCDSEEVKLTPKEFDLLETLILNRNIALTRERLLDLVWDMNFEGDTRTVDIHIQQLRKKLGLKNRIKSMYKIGYRFEL